MNFISDTILAVILGLDKSKPIERTWKGFLFLISSCAVCMLVVYGAIALLF